MLMSSVRRTIVPAAFGIAFVLLPSVAFAQVDPFGRPYSGERTIAPGTPICGSTDVDKPVKMIRGNRPGYPLESNLQGLSGTAILQVEIDASGKVKVLSAEIKESESKEAKWFANHAVVAVNDWKLEPATKDGVPVPIICKMKFKFESESE